MSWEPDRFKDLHQIPREEHVFSGAPLCAGCGGLESLRLASKILGWHVVYVNAAGCFTNLATFPFTPLDASWLYTTMGSAPAGAQGVRDALDVLIAKGRLPKEEDVTVVVVGGDGSTYDMALSSTSGAITRKLDFYYFCYDNEAYGNTGVQLSPSTPYGAKTTTSPCAVQRPVGATQEKKISSKFGEHTTRHTSQRCRRVFRSTWKKSSCALGNIEAQSSSWDLQLVRPDGYSTRLTHRMSRD